MPSSSQGSTPSSPPRSLLDPRAGQRLRVVLLLSLAGAALAAFLLADHYRLADAGFCTIGPGISCQEVNRSEYSEIAGIPIAGIGLAGFLLLFGIAFAALSGSGRGVLRQPMLLLTLLSVVGVGFGTALLLVELFVLETLCLLCLGSYLAQIGILVLLIPLFAAERSARARPG